MLKYLTAITAILLILLGWIVVQHMARRFAETHPELGASREEGSGCGKNCMCAAGGACTRETESSA
ncbi:MAG: chemotaxis protein [SAR324 cluster bacterium]|nr:chemotaxis protein [SAR324 cluster bacterium]